MTCSFYCYYSLEVLSVLYQKSIVSFSSQRLCVGLSERVGLIFKITLTVAILPVLSNEIQNG